MVDFSSVAKVLVRAERETTLAVLQAHLCIATSRHLLARVAAERTPRFGICAGDITALGLRRLTDERSVARALATSDDYRAR